MIKGKHKRIHATMLAAGLAVLSLPGHADYKKGGIGFSFIIDHSRTDWQFATSRSQSKQSRLGIIWEEALTSRFKGGIRTGYLDLSQPDNPVSAARISTGYYAGINFTGLLIDTDAFHLDTYLDYSYHNTRGTDNTETADTIWYQTEAGLRLKLRITDYTYVSLGGSYILTDGEQRLSGSSSQISEFEETESPGYSIGLAYQTDQTGQVSVSWQGGNRDGVHIYFSRRF